MSFAHAGFAGSFVKTIETEPSVDAAGGRAISPEALATAFTIVIFGRQPSLFMAKKAWSENLPNAKIANVSAPDPFSCATCDATSVAVGS